MSPNGASPELHAVDALLEAGRTVEALDELVEINRRNPRPTLQLQLRDLRVEAAAAWAPGGGRTPWPPLYADPFPHLTGEIPTIDHPELTTPILGGAVAHHGALIVRDVFEADVVERLVQAIEKIRERRGASGVPEPSEDLAVECLFRPLRRGSKAVDPVLRKLQHDQGGTWLADSPAVTAIVLDNLAEAGIVQVVGEHFGERPFISLQKSTLRRTPSTFSLVSWHQDGAFLGDEVRTMNVWVALSSCGEDLPTPALEMLPRRLDDVLPPEGELVPNSVSAAQVREVAEGTPTIVPGFAPGDAIIFDERFLHRTHLTQQMTDTRYALECWFFAPSHAAPAYTPLLA